MRELAEWRSRTAHDRPQRWSADVGEYETLHAGRARLVGDVQYRHVPTCAAREPDGPAPGGRFGEHQVGAGGPGWKREELRRPDDQTAAHLDAISERRMIGVDDRLWSNDELAAPERVDRRLQLAAARETSNGGDELAARVRDQPSVERPGRIRVWATVDHHPCTGVCNQQTCWRIPRRRRRTHPNGHEAHERNDCPISASIPVAALFRHEARI